MADDDNRVGYGRPPLHTRFKPGQSGNPRGRPKGARSFKSELKAELDEWVTITENGRPRRVRKRRVFIKTLVAKAAKGDAAATNALLRVLMAEYGIEDERPPSAPLSANDQAILEAMYTYAAPQTAGPSAPRVSPGSGPEAPPPSPVTHGETEASADAPRVNQPLGPLPVNVPSSPPHTVRQEHEGKDPK